MSEYTKGKWTVGQSLPINNMVHIFIGSPKGKLARVDGYLSGKSYLSEEIRPTKEEAEANARFICKAVNNFDGLLEALREIRDLETECCHRCEGNGKVYADGKGHLISENAPTVLCGNCGGSGQILPEIAQEIAEQAIAAAEKE